MLLVNTDVESIKEYRKTIFLGSMEQVPSRHETLTQCWFNVGPPSSTLDQHWFNVSCLQGHRRRYVFNPTIPLVVFAVNRLCHTRPPPLLGVKQYTHYYDVLKKYGILWQALHLTTRGITGSHIISS